MYRSLAVFFITACSSLPAPAAPQVPPHETAPRSIHVNSTSVVKRAPDRAVVQLAVVSTAATAREATRQNSAAMERVLAAVRGAGIPPSDIQTLRIELSPRYARPREGEEPRITGYEATNQVLVTVDDVSRVGAVVDAGVNAGANRVTGINFELQDPDAAHHEALRDAIRKARVEAQVIADALGEPLGPALQVITSVYRPMPVHRGAPMAMEMGRGGDMQAPPVEPGEIDVEASVSITFRIGS